MFELIFYILFFFFNDTPPTEIYTLSLHDALPISPACLLVHVIAQLLRKDEPDGTGQGLQQRPGQDRIGLDRKSTRLNSSHQIISYAVFCLKKKKQNIQLIQTRDVIK